MAADLKIKHAILTGIRRNAIFRRVFAPPEPSLVAGRDYATPTGEDWAKYNFDKIWLDPESKQYVSSRGRGPYREAADNRYKPSDLPSECKNLGEINSYSRISGWPSNVEFIDIYPTLCQLAHLPAPPQQLDGASFVPLLKNPKVHLDCTSRIRMC